MPRWITNERGTNQESEESYYDHTDYDAYSCMDLMGLPGRTTGIADVEDPSVVSHMDAEWEDEPES